MSIIFIAWSSCSAGILLDSIPAPYENFLPSIEQKHYNLVSLTPKPSPNPTPFSFSILLIAYKNFKYVGVCIFFFILLREFNFAS